MEQAIGSSLRHVQARRTDHTCGHDIVAAYTPWLKTDGVRASLPPPPSTTRRTSWRCPTSCPTCCAPLVGVRRSVDRRIDDSELRFDAPNLSDSRKRIPAGAHGQASCLSSTHSSCRCRSSRSPRSTWRWHLRRRPRSPCDRHRICSSNGSGSSCTCSGMATRRAGRSERCRLCSGQRSAFAPGPAPAPQSSTAIRQR